MFDVDLKNAGHVSGLKMVHLIASCTKLFPGVVESSEEEESSSGYSDLSPRDIEEI